MAGVSATTSERTSSAALVSVFGDASASDGLHLEPIGTFGWVGAHRTRKENLHRDVLLAGGGLRIVGGHGHWFASEQLAMTSVRTDALSSPLEFMTSTGWQGRRLIFAVRHVSNGRILGGGKNLGETMLLAGMRW